MPYRISILTPTFQMARFLSGAIESVLRQREDGLQYIVLDAQSTDGSAEVLRLYSNRIEWRSQRDTGPADALRRGFAACEGEILGWLNADDVLLPGAIDAALQAFANNPGAVAVFSGGRWVNEELRPIRAYPVSANAANALSYECRICQPACFFRADAYRECGGLDASLQSAFDYDLWIRMARLGSFVHVPGEWALARMHRGAKTFAERGLMFAESQSLLKRHYGYVPFHWVYGDIVFRRDGRDQFFEDLEPSVPAYLWSLPAGLARNPAHAPRYLREWASQLTWNGLKRRLGAGEPG